MRLRFRIRTAPSQDSGGQLDRVVDVEPAGDEVRIGRRAGLEIQLPFGTVSSLHARVVRHGNGWALLDMGSVNGTFVGDSRLQVGLPKVINPGETIKVADVSIVFEGVVGGTPAPAKGTESTATIARRLVNDLFQAVAGAEVARVMVETGSSAGKSVSLVTPDRAYKVGRAPDCDLVLSDDAISREHAAFERRWQGVFVKDLGSKNGIEVDSKKVKDEQRVHDGQLVTVGSIKLKVDDPEERYLRRWSRPRRRPVARPRPPSPPCPPAARPAAAPGGAVAAAAGLAKPTAPVASPPAAAKPAPAAPKPAAGSPAAVPPVKEADRPAPAKVAAVVPSRGAAAVSQLSQKIDQLGERTSRVLPFFVTVFSLAVLGGVAYLVYLMFFGMAGDKP